MVAPGNRRPGHSRRAQYGTFFSYVFAVIGLGLGVMFLASAYDEAPGVADLRADAADAASSPAQAGASARTASQSWAEVLGGYFTSGSRVARLEREVAEARVKLAESAAQAEENKRLKALLGLTEVEPRPVAIARLIGSTSSSTRRFATLGAGSAQGVRPGMPVRSPLGLVGRVTEVGDRSARVLLITDTASSVPVRRASDGVQAYATGRGDGTLAIRLTTSGLNPLKKGDAIVTSGSGGLYRPGEAVGVVTQVTRDGAIASPLSDPGMTEFVAVEQPWDETQPPPLPEASSQAGK